TYSNFEDFVLYIYFGTEDNYIAFIVTDSIVETDETTADFVNMEIEEGIYTFDIIANKKIPWTQSYSYGRIRFESSEAYLNHSGNSAYVSTSSSNNIFNR